jgi:hypothetical protein
MASNAIWNIPPIPEVHPNGSCYCECGETLKRGKFFVTNPHATVERACTSKPTLVR